MKILRKLYPAALVLATLSLVVAGCENLNEKRSGDSSAHEGGPSPSSPSSDIAQPLTVEEQLDVIRAQDHDRVESLVGSWVPQFASGEANQSTLDIHNTEWAGKYGAVLLKGDDYIGYLPNYWISVLPQTFSTSDDVLSWCKQQAIGREHCAAKFVTHDESITDTIRYQDE